MMMQRKSTLRHMFEDASGGVPATGRYSTTSQHESDEVPPIENLESKPLADYSSPKDAGQDTNGSGDQSESAAHNEKSHTEE